MEENKVVSKTDVKSKAEDTNEIVLVVDQRVKPLHDDIKKDKKKIENDNNVDLKNKWSFLANQHALLTSISMFIIIILFKCGFG